MPTKRRMVPRVALLFVLLPFILSHCTGLGRTDIGDIKNKPRDYADKEVVVSGEVVDTFSVIVFKSFTLRDKTGEITVVTKRPLPKRGEKLKVRGIVREAFSIGSESRLVIEEEPEKPR